jgi:hypothetical protein
MTNENYWMLDESSLSLEEWMTNDNYWNSNAVIVSEETENSLKVESWMTDEKIWK